MGPIQERIPSLPSYFSVGQLAVSHLFMHNKGEKMKLKVTSLYRPSYQKGNSPYQKSVLRIFKSHSLPEEVEMFLKYNFCSIPFSMCIRT